MTEVEPWNGEPRVVMWTIARNGAVIRHNFYHQPISQAAIERAQEWEYERGCVTWLDYRDAAKVMADRSWWKRVYKAGIRADLDGQPRTPPDDLTDDQREVWLAGYDR